MDCKYCGAPLEDDSQICPVCHKEQTDTPEQTAPLTDKPAEEAAQDALEQQAAVFTGGEEADETAEDAEEPAEDAEEPAEDAEEPAEDVDETAEDVDETAQGTEVADEGAEESDTLPKKKRHVGLFVVLGVVGALVLAMLVYMAVYCVQHKDNGFVDNLKAAPAALWHKVSVTVNPYASQVEDKAVYTVDSAAVGDKNMTKVVVKCGDTRITAAQFQIFYWMQYYNFMSSYGAYASVFGLDTTQPLSEQQSMQEGLTWEQYFVSAAMEQAKEYAAMAEQAAQEGYTLDSELQASLDAMPTDLESQATDAGFESADAYVQESFGAGVGVDDYAAFLKLYYTALSFENDHYSGITYTDEDISAYYDENADSYAESGVEKSDKHNVAVRHILLQPDDEDGDGTYTDKAWDLAKEKADEVLALFEADPTEDNFAALAEEYSADPGSNTNGGLYENVAPGQMEDEFDAWCFEDGRKPGDTGMVKTSHGYHIMYFVDTTDTLYWYETAASDYMNDTMTDWINQVRENHNPKSNYLAISLVQPEAVTQSVG